MLVDIHVHTCRPRHPEVSRKDGSHYPSPALLIEMMDGVGIDKAVVLRECPRLTFLAHSQVFRAEIGSLGHPPKGAEK